MIGIIVEALALIPSLIVVQLFRRIRPRSQSSSSTKSSRKWTLPWWSLYLVYGLCLILVAVSIFMIIARGIEFGDEKAQKWLISILTGFFSSVLISQPLKVIISSSLFEVHPRWSRSLPGCLCHIGLFIHLCSPEPAADRAWRNFDHFATTKISSRWSSFRWLRDRCK